MNNKNELIMQTAIEIAKYIDDLHGVQIDENDIATIININVGFVFDTSSEVNSDNGYGD
jgi:hypothetical protein